MANLQGLLIKHWNRLMRSSNKLIFGNKRTFCTKNLFNCYSSFHHPSGNNDGLIVKSPFPNTPIPNKTFIQLLKEQHTKWKNLIAIECGISGQAYTYHELFEKSESLARSLGNAGLQPGDVLVLVLPNMPSFVIIVLGAASAGLTICPINPVFTYAEIAYQIKNSEAKCVITSSEKLNDVVKAVDYLTTQKESSHQIKIFSINEEIKLLPFHVMPLQENENPQGTVNSYTDLQAMSEDSLESTAVIAFTSGTTSQPKGVCLSNRNLTASILIKSQPPMSPYKETTSIYQDVLPILSPLSHSFAFDNVLTALYNGSKIVTLPKFEQETFLTALKKTTLLLAAPPTLLFLGSRPEVTKEHMTYLRCIITGAAPIGEKDILKCLVKAPPDTKFGQAYGLTEAQGLAYTPYGVVNYKSVGVPLLNTEMKVIDLENGSSKQAFQEGELCFRGPQISQGYLNNPEATKELIDSEGWLHSGDVGYYDNKGYIYIMDRKKEIIKVKGFQVAPSELEEVLRSHPAIEEAGVIGISHERKGEEPVAFIKVNQGINICDQELKTFLGARVAPFKMINKFIFVTAIPKSPSGKILRKNLRKML